MTSQDSTNKGEDRGRHWLRGCIGRPALIMIPLAGLVLSLAPVGGTCNDGIAPARETAVLVQKSASATVFNTDVFTLYSKTVSDTFEISIAYPRSYGSSDRSYPVVYLLDPSLFFATAAQITHTLTNNPATRVDEVLLVGIGYPLSESNWFEEMSRRRIRDLTPPGFSLEHDRVQGVRLADGARRFLTFIEKELDPAIRKSFRAEGSTAGIMGTARGGVFALYAFAERSRLFDRYWMGSTGFTDENDPVLKKFEAALKDGPLQETWLFLSVGELELRNLERMGTVDHHEFVSTTYNKLVRLLKGSLPPTVHAVTHIFPQESHSTVPASALTRAFIVLYSTQR